MKKVVFVQPVLTPYSIGRFRELAKNDDIEVIVFFERSSFSHRPGWYAQEIERCSVEIINSYVKKTQVRGLGRGYVINGVRTIPYRLPKLIFRYRPDIVVVCNASELLFCDLLKGPLNYKIGLICEDTTQSARNKPRFVRCARSMIYRRADFFLPFSEDSVEYLRRIGINRNVYRTSWSIDLEFFESNYDPFICESIRNKLDLNDKFVFLSVSQLIPQKGLINLLRAWLQLPITLKSKIALVIIGSGSQEKEIKDLISRCNIPNVWLIGQISYSEITNYFHACDVFILPTLQDVFGLTVMEAMACGIPVLTTYYCGARELVVDGRNGYLFDSRDLQEIRDVIIKIVNQRKRLRRMGQISYAMIQEYSHSKIMADMGRILEGI